MTRTSKFSLFVVILAVTMLAPRLANAYCVYNSKNSDRTVMIAQLQKGGGDYRGHPSSLGAYTHGWSKWFVSTLAPGGKSCCNWKNRDCNNGGRDTPIIFSAVDQSKTGTDQDFKAQECYKVIPAGGALMVTARRGNISCKERSKYGRDLRYYHQLNKLSWKMRRVVNDANRLSTRKQRKDRINWNNVFEGGNLADGRKQGICRGYLTPGDRGLDMIIYKKITGKKVRDKNAKSLLLGRLENETCIAELFGEQFRFGSFEYLTRGTAAKWVKSDGGRAGSHEAMYAGVDWTGHLLNICRAKYKGAVHPGKQWSNQCYIAVDGKGIGIKPPFEVLVSR